jgi:hypothetical protein
VKISKEILREEYQVCMYACICVCVCVYVFDLSMKEGERIFFLHLASETAESRLRERDVFSSVSSAFKQRVLRDDVIDAS